MEEGPTAPGRAKARPAAEPLEEEDRLPAPWRKAIAVVDMASKIALPVVILAVGCWVDRSIARIEAAPDLIELALRTIEQEPLGQPEGVRDWAVDMLGEYSSTELDEELADRLRAGWSFQVPYEFVGQVAFEGAEPATAELDGHAFELRFVTSEGEPALQQVALSMPEMDRTVIEPSLDTTNILRIPYGARVYLFRFEELEGSTALFSVWKQSPGIRDVSDLPIVLPRTP